MANDKATIEKSSVIIPREGEVVLSWNSEGWRQTTIVKVGEELSAICDTINKEHESIQG